LKTGDELSFPAPIAFLLQDANFWSMIQGSVLTLAVMGVLICFSIYSWTIIFSKWAAVRGARKTNDRFLRAFRKSTGLEAVMVASERYRPSPLVTVFDFGYEEVERQVRGRNKMTNRAAVERALQIGVSEEMSRLERNMSWLATTATASPFIGLLGTVLGIIQAFMDLSQQQSTSLRTVGPGIAEALIATAVGLMAAIPAAIFYNLLSTRIRDIGTRMDDFALEFLNMVERGFTVAAARRGNHAFGNQRHTLRGCGAGAADHLHAYRACDGVRYGGRRASHYLRAGDH
jgi:biopolymer transport protein TolQ